MTCKFIKSASTNLVPAVAVIRGMRVLFSINGRKVYQGGFNNFALNIIGRTMVEILYFKTKGIKQVYSICRGRVKFYDNTKTSCRRR